MEFTEVVSPSVAVPVLCVLVCAFLVFAFGFKSPAQPPSFDVFDEDGKKKRGKKSKGSKSQSNGHAVVAGEGDINNSAKVQSSPRQTSKLSSKTQTTVTKSKSAAQSSQEAPKKVKKQAVKEEDNKVVKSQAGKEDVNKWQNDADGWHTVPKKDKKQKKKESEIRQEKQEPLVKEEVKVEEPAAPAPPPAAPAAASVDTPVDIPEEKTGSPPQEQRNKKKKEKKNKKTKLEEEIVEQAKIETPAVSKPPTNIAPEPEVVDASIELQIKDAMETTVNNDNATVENKKKLKKDKKKAQSKKVEDDFVIPQAATATEVVQEPVEDLPLKENTDALTVKVSKKKQKKDRNKKEETLAESIEIGASGQVDSSLSQPSVSNIQPKTTKLKESSVKEEPRVVESSEDGGASSNTTSPAEPTALFDELGGTTESWTEAKPKSKKKKARRAD